MFNSSIKRMTDPKEKQSCLACNKSLKSGRPDKKFCNDGCRNQYNNKRMQAERAEIKTIDIILKHNRRILKEALNGEVSRKLPREQLVQKGFRFDFHTHYYTNYKDDRYIFCYDYGYLPLSNDQCLVVKSKG